MAGPTKQDITTIFKRLRSNPANKQCFDCKALNPTWASVTYGVFLCIDCSAVHRSLGVHLTFIRSTQLDTSWTWLQLRAMQVGGNSNGTAFFRQHGCTSADAQQKYNSRAAKLYREKLHHLATQAMREYGTKHFDVKLSHADGNKLHIDSHSSAESPSPDVKEVDFFKEHHDSPLADTTETTPSMCFSSENAVSGPKPISNGSLAKSKAATAVAESEDPGHGPSVDHALSISPTQAQAQAEPRKSTIGARKPTSAKKGFGAKKGGLGAQRVRANFSEIESKAQQRDQQKDTLEKIAKEHEAKTKEDQEKQMASMRLAYQDMSVERKKQEDKMKKLDPKKAEQFERLGMGFTSQRSASHSIANDMQVIEQEAPANSRSSFDRYSAKKERERDFFEDEFEFVGGFSSGPPKYNDSPFGKKEDRFGSSNWGSNGKSSSWDTADRFESKQSSFTEDIPAKDKQDDSVEDIPGMASPDEDDRSGRARKNYEAASGSDAQKKFGNAKAISSDAFFSGSSSDFEHRQNMSRFEGSSGISSDDYFGRETKKDHYGGGGNANAPDLDEIREGVRQGVTKVAGKLSSLANGMITSLQDKYTT